MDAIDPQRKYITHTLYRDATLATEHYQCVKDMNRLNRPLEVRAWPGGCRQLKWWCWSETVDTRQCLHCGAQG